MSSYDFDGEKYRQASKHQKEWGHKLIADINFTGHEIILDLGCGDGVLTAELSMLVPNGKVVGIDSSDSMINTAKQLSTNNLTFVCLDINELNYSNKFDIIYSNAALHWVKNHGKLLQNCYTALKPGGQLTWNFAADGTCENFYAVIDSVMSLPLYHEYFISYECPWYMPQKDEYISLMKKIEFQTFNVEYENMDRYFADADEMTKWIDQPSIVPFLAYLPDDMKHGFRDLIVNKMIDNTKQPDGRCFETFRRLKVTATK